MITYLCPYYNLWILKFYSFILNEMNIICEKRVLTNSYNIVINNKYILA